MSPARALRLNATVLLGVSLAAGILNLTVLHDPEVTFGVSLGVTVAIAVLLAARPRKGNQ